MSETGGNPYTTIALDGFECNIVKLPDVTYGGVRRDMVTSAYSGGLNTHYHYKIDEANGLINVTIGGGTEVLEKILSINDDKSKFTVRLIRADNTSKMMLGAVITSEIKEEGETQDIALEIKGKPIR